jgi:hypothetical protein
MYLYHVLFVAINIRGIDCQKKTHEYINGKILYPLARMGMGMGW